MYIHVNKNKYKKHWLTGAFETIPCESTEAVTLITSNCVLTCSIDMTFIKLFIAFINIWGISRYIETAATCTQKLLLSVYMAQVVTCDTVTEYIVHFTQYIVHFIFCVSVHIVNIPAQFAPFPVYPSLHWQSKPPTLSMHVALTWQSSKPKSHKLKSIKNNEGENDGNHRLITMFIANTHIILYMMYAKHNQSYWCSQIHLQCIHNHKYKYRIPQCSYK